MITAFEAVSEPSRHKLAMPPSASAIARVSASLWREIGATVKNFDNMALYIEDHDLIEIFVDDPEDLDTSLVDKLAAITKAVVICLPLHTIGKAHKIWYGKDAWVQGWSLKADGNIAFYESEIA